MNNTGPEADFPFDDLFGTKKEKLTPAQQFGKDLLEIAKKFPVDNSVDN